MPDPGTKDPSTISRDWRRDWSNLPDWRTGDTTAILYLSSPPPSNPVVSLLLLLSFKHKSINFHIKDK